MSYKSLEIWQLARDLVIDIHKMTLTELPKFEMYEVGSQIRRSSKSVKSMCRSWLKPFVRSFYRDSPLGRRQGLRKGK